MSSNDLLLSGDSHVDPEEAFIIVSASGSEAEGKAFQFVEKRGGPRMSWCRRSRILLKVPPHPSSLLQLTH